MALPVNWKNWIVEQLFKGKPAVQILNKIMENGFRFEDGKAALGNNLPKNINSPFNNDFYAALSKPKFLGQNQYALEDYSSEQIQLFGIPNFLSEAECKSIIEVAQDKFEPSQISTQTGFGAQRTSTTCNLTFINAPIVGQVEQRIVQALELGVGENEVIQAQRYQIGQEFKSHKDYFEPGSDEYRRHATKRGQRTWTCMIYLNEGCTGGETEFTKVGKVFQPKMGFALIWNNLLADGSPNPNTLHHAHPVKEGEKYVITKWFRTFKQ